MGLVFLVEHAAALLHPFGVGRGREILAHPHQEHQHHADGEGEAEIVVRVLRPFRPGAERFRPHPRQQQAAPEGDVEAGDAEDDEAHRGQPMDEALEGVEAQDRRARKAGPHLHAAAPQIEDGEQRDHAEDGDAADPLQRDGVEFAPIAAGRMLEHIGLGVGDRPAALDHLELVEQLLLFHRAAVRIDRGRLLGRRRGRHCDDKRECEHASDEADPRKKRRHGISPL